MKDDRRFESLLHDALSRRGEPAPFSIDVADRMMSHVARLGPPRRLEVRYFVRWAAAASIAGLALIAAAVWRGPALDALVTGFGFTAAGLATMAAKLAAPANVLVESLGRVLNALAGSARTLVQPLAPFQPLVRLLLVTLTAGMLGVTTFIVGRDVRSRVSDEERA